MTRGKTKKERLILLKDLAPRTDPKGGAAGKSVFGEIFPLTSTGERPGDPPDTRETDAPNSANRTPEGKGARK
jgi:hypothetical protein